MLELLRCHWSLSINNLASHMYLPLGIFHLISSTDRIFFTLYYLVYYFFMVLNYYKGFKRILTDNGYDTILLMFYVMFSKWIHHPVLWVRHVLIQWQYIERQGSDLHSPASLIILYWPFCPSACVMETSASVCHG